MPMLYVLCTKCGIIKCTLNVARISNILPFGLKVWYLFGELLVVEAPIEDQKEDGQTQENVKSDLETKVHTIMLLAVAMKVNNKSVLFSLITTGWYDNKTRPA